MLHRNFRHLPSLLLLAAVGCGSSGSTPPVTSDPQMAADFALEDVNDTSPTLGQDVSPRDFLGSVSGWYFGDAT
jgi:hypothetical protein